MTDEIIEKMTGRMDKAIAALENELVTVRTGRANPNILARVNVLYYGEQTPINQVANISVVEGRQLVVKPYDRGSMKDIIRAINEADLGLNPQNDGQVIRIVIPPLTEERRKELVKQVSKMAEQSKVAVRNIRRDGNEAIKKGGFSEDETKLAQEKVQKKTDEYIKKIDKIAKDKEKDIMTV